MDHLMRLSTGCTPSSSILVVLVAVLLAGCAFDVPVRDRPADPAVIRGVVTGPDGPEAGVWVIAETEELPTKFARIVVTDDRGRYLIPELPDARYTVWVRGYGLMDSRAIEGRPGTVLDLEATPAPDPATAARYYPAAYWFSLLEVPPASAFPGTGPDGNGISESVEAQADWLRTVKSGSCLACHQLGNEATREIPDALGEFDSHEAAWDRRVKSGQAGAWMSGGLDRLGREASLAMFGDWTAASPRASCRRCRRGRRGSSATS
jgi:hypothetical protein